MYLALFNSNKIDQLRKNGVVQKTSIKISLEIWTENILTRKRKFQIVSCVFKWFFVLVDHQRCEVKGRTTGTTWSVTGTKGGRNETSGWGTSGGTKSLTLLRIEALIIAFGKSKLSYISCPFWMASVLVLVLVFLNDAPLSHLIYFLKIVKYIVMVRQ